MAANVRTLLAARSDEELAADYAATGDRGAIEELIRRYAPRVRRMVLALVGGDEAFVRDAEQEILITMVRRLDRFRGRSSFATFFYRVARNRVVDLTRSRSRYGRRVISLPEPDGRVSRFPGPAESAENQERLELLRKAMTVLSAEDRLMLYLKDGEDHKVESLSEMTGLKAGTIKSRLARSRSKVADALRELGYEH